MKRKQTEKRVLVVHSTAPDRETAESIAENFVKSGVAACASVGGPIKSFYFWKGEYCSDTEFAIELKLSPKKLSEAEDLMGRLHPYECPQFIVVGAETSDAYSDWINGMQSGVD